jgi:hypothetical protein
MTLGQEHKGGRLKEEETTGKEIVRGKELAQERGGLL